MVNVNNTTEARTSTPAWISSSQNLVVHVVELLHARRGGGRTRNPRVAAVNLSGELVAVNQPRDVVGVLFVDLVALWLRCGHGFPSRSCGSMTPASGLRSAPSFTSIPGFTSGSNCFGPPTFADASSFSLR